MEELEHSCAFTGHRPYKLPWKYNVEDPRCVALNDRLRDQVVQLAAEGITDFYCGMAEGTDVYAATAVLLLKQSNPGISLHCIIPYSAQPDKWLPSSQAMYFEILARADEVKELSHDYYDGCLLDRNRYMVDHARYLLAVYNGEYRGGTAATVRYAQKLGRKVIIMNPATGEITL